MMASASAAAKECDEGEFLLLKESSDRGQRFKSGGLNKPLQWRNKEWKRNKNDLKEFFNIVNGDSALWKAR